jgi:glutamate racemase
LIKIGIFDSGIGGLTVYREVKRAISGADILYFGDTARVPYGTKSARTVTRYALQITEYLVDNGVDLVVVACNTASAFAVDAVREAVPVPVFGVVEPGARAAVRATRKGSVGVLGTRGTISSGAYQKAISDLDNGIEIVATPCPLFVPLVEEGWLVDPITQDVAIRYLEPHLEAGVDTLVLGCTHYPLLKKVISMVMGEEITLIDSAEETAGDVKSYVQNAGSFNDSDTTRDRFEVSDSPDRFLEVGRIFLDRDLGEVRQVDLADGEEEEPVKK